MSCLSRKLREREFVELTRELLDSEQVRMMGRWKHHGPVTTLDHSLFVAFSTYRVARLLQFGCARRRPGGPAPRPVPLRLQGQIRPPGEPVL